MKKSLITFLLSALATISAAASTSPAGRWVTIDDETGEIKSHVTIWEENRELMGRIDKLVNPFEPNPVCDQCKGTRQNQPIEGMTFIWGLAEDKDEWNGGYILDPANGKEYKAKVKLTDGGQKLEVRGFIGFSLIGRTQIWERLVE